MKLIIAGGREHQLSDPEYAKLDQIHELHHITEVVSGCARGVDRCGELWAILNNLAIARKKPDWIRYGSPLAAYMRNQEMANYADALAVFRGGNGTADMLKRAQEKKLLIFDFQKV